MVNEKKKGRYRHFKGNEYELVDFARCSETDSKMVIYRPLNTENNDLWVRPEEMFFGTVERNGKVKKRFEYIGKLEMDL